MSKFIPQNFNDFLALILVFLIPALWIVQGKQIIALDNAVNGALVVLFTLVVQYYYRKKAEDVSTSITTVDTKSTSTTTVPPEDKKDV